MSTTATNIEDVLEQCGVTPNTLTSAERAALDEQGFVILVDVMDAAWLNQLRTAFETAAATNGSNSPARKETGTRHVSDLPYCNEVFAEVCTNPRVLAAVYHVVQRPFKIQQLHGRDPLPGFGQQGLHTDWMARAPHEPYYAATALWLLDDFTPHNGPTRLIPGSHRWPKPLPKTQQAPEAHHPQEQSVIAKAGAVLVFNGHLYHGGTRNQSQASRRVLQCPFVPRASFVPDNVREDVPAWLTPAAQYLLGI